MKTKLTLGAILMFGALSASTFAATTSSSLTIHDNNVNIINAEVTAVSGNIVNAITRFKDVVTNWSVATNASTSIMTTRKSSAAAADIHVGDKVNISGSLTSFGSSLGLTATKILDVTQAESTRTLSGTVSSVNTSNGTFVLTRDGKNTTVVTTASTSFKLIPAATTTNQLANLTTNSKVMVLGVLSSDGTTLTASTVVATNLSYTKDKKMNNGFFHGLKNGWKDKEKNETEDANEHQGLFKWNIGLFRK